MSAVVAEAARNKKKQFGKSNQLYVKYTCKTIYAVIKTVC